MLVSLSEWCQVLIAYIDKLSSRRVSWSSALYKHIVFKIKVLFQTQTFAFFFSEHNTLHKPTQAPSDN